MDANIFPSADAMVAGSIPVTETTADSSPGKGEEDGVVGPYQFHSSLVGRISLVALVQALAVADHLDFRWAAEALGTNLSTVSQRIKVLEGNLGVSLFERHPRGVRLTPAGRSFLDEIAQGLEHLDYAVKSAGMTVRGEQGHLGIGLYSPIAEGFLADLLKDYRTSHPGVGIEMAEGRAHGLIRQVREERLDIAFVLGAPKIADCQCRPLWTETLVVALPAQHPLAEAEIVRWTDLATETFIVRNGGIGPQLHDHIVARLAERALRPTVRHFDVGRDTMMSLVAQGYGLALTTGLEPKSSFPNVAVCRIADEPEPLVFSAVWLPFNRSGTLRDILDLAQRQSQRVRKVAPVRLVTSHPS
jgi:DNA-binding transcriptional LysR family regulator